MNERISSPASSKVVGISSFLANENPEPTGESKYTILALLFHENGFN